jgi:hypothetical protein
VATADAGGLVPSLVVPRAPLTAVTELAGDVALDPIDTSSSCAGITIDAPALTAITGFTRGESNATLGDVRVEAQPRGALALAGVPTVVTTSSGAGAFTLALASGGSYHLRFFDPGSRRAPLVLDDVVAAGQTLQAALPTALAITGKVSLVGNANPIVGASVQLLCASCTGIDVSLPVAETSTDTASRYRIAAPDPGTM